jgi:hypothetical protein
MIYPDLLLILVKIEPEPCRRSIDETVRTWAAAALGRDGAGHCERR